MFPASLLSYYRLQTHTTNTLAIFVRARCRNHFLLRKRCRWHAAAIEEFGKYPGRDRLGQSATPASSKKREIFPWSTSDRPPPRIEFPQLPLNTGIVSGHANSRHYLVTRGHDGRVNGSEKTEGKKAEEREKEGSPGKRSDRNPNRSSGHPKQDAPSLKREEFLLPRAPGARCAIFNARDYLTPSGPAANIA